MSSTSFSVGLRFYYWVFYESLKEFPEQKWYNINDHSGYAVCDLYIRARYGSLKEEMCYYPYFSMKQYREEVIIKVNQYINAKIVKNTKAHRSVKVLHYGIVDGDKLLYSHLVSLVLYCDYSKLSAAFSRSFRKASRFQTIENIKLRNSKYYYFAKYLRETVEAYGQCSRGDYINGKFGVNKLSGPFYCGMNILLEMPSFNIRLCAPTSTSMHIEVALKFSTEQGIIIQFQNPKDMAQYNELRGFNVSWLSRYKEEDERFVLFIFV